MTEIIHESPDAFLTHKFYTEVRLLGGFAIEHNADEIAGMAEFLTHETGQNVLPAPIEQLDFAYYLDVGGLRPWKWDKHYIDAPDDFRYMLGGRIEPNQKDPTPENSITKAEIAARGTTILEIQAKNLRDQPLSHHLARTFLIPPHKDPQARFIAGPDEWGRQIQDEVVRAATHEGPRSQFGGVDDPRLTAAAAQRFPAAVVLRRHL